MPFERRALAKSILEVNPNFQPETRLNLIIGFAVKEPEDRDEVRSFTVITAVCLPFSSLTLDSTFSNLEIRFFSQCLPPLYSMSSSPASKRFENLRPINFLIAFNLNFINWGTIGNSESVSVKIKIVYQISNAGSDFNSGISMPSLSRFVKS